MVTKKRKGSDGSAHNCMVLQEQEAQISHRVALLGGGNWCFLVSKVFSLPHTVVLVLQTGSTAST